MRTGLFEDEACGVEGLDGPDKLGELAADAGEPPNSDGGLSCLVALSDGAGVGGCDADSMSGRAPSEARLERAVGGEGREIASNRGSGADSESDTIGSSRRARAENSTTSGGS